MTTAHDLTARLTELLRRERAAMADFLLALADFDRQRLWLELGYPSLFMFLHRELGLSKGAAHFRKVAAELVQRFPGVVEPLRGGRLCITSVVELARVATAEDFEEVMPRFFHCSRREAREVAVRISPATLVPRREVTTPIPETSTRSAILVPGDAARVLPVELNPPVRAVSPSSASAPARRDSMDPLTADLRRLHVTVSRRFLDKLERARSALSHSRPGAGAEEILEAGLDLILAADARRKGAVERPLAKQRPSRPDHVPASARREVWKRDQGRCQWPISGRAGGICGSTLRVQVDHALPRARGGPSTVDNLRLLCAVHNQAAARLDFGDALIDRRVRRGGRMRRSPAAERRACPGPAG